MQLKRWSSSSSSTSIKLKTLFLTLITNSLYRLLRSLSRAKSILIELNPFMMMFYSTKSSIKHHNIFFGSSSHVGPVTKPFPFSLHSDEDEDGHESQYLKWLKENVSENNNINDDDDDIDHLADVFIASCHERFLLEKVESYRRFEEMLTRSL